MDADGYLYLSDRQSDMVISGGVNIHPAEIEACRLNLPGVADAAVFGIPLASAAAEAGIRDRGPGAPDPLVPPLLRRHPRRLPVGDSQPVSSFVTASGCSSADR